MAHATVGEQEWVDGVLDPETLAALVRQFRAEGFATLGNAVPHAALDALRQRLDHDAAHQAAEQKFVERGERSGAGGHLQMGLPRMAP